MIINEDMLRKYAPSVFATEPEDGRVSDRYTFFPTTDIIEVLQEEGWEAWKATQVRTRVWSKNHAKHIVRLRHRDLDVGTFSVGDSFPEMLLVNAHNGIGSYTLQGGVFRLVCSNGMVISEEDFGKIVFRHIGFDPEEVKEASRKYICALDGISSKINTWKETILSDRSRTDFFTDAAKLRFENPDDGIIDSISTPRRDADRGNDLWRVVNVAQENLIRGGYKNNTTRRPVKAITGIQADINLNQKIWELASSYATN